MKALRIDLTRERISEEEIEADYLGGRGLGVQVLSREVDPKVEPLSWDNKLIFSIGPITGTRIPFSGRCNATSKSPLTGTIFSSNAGGMFGYEISKTGYKAILIEGRAEEPLYLKIEKEAELLSADNLWGKTVSEVVDALKKERMRETNIACIGPAGENLVRFANIMVQGHRAFGRGGLGAVMGSKKLKAVVVKGTEKAKAERYSRLVKALKRKIIDTPSALKTQGTSNILAVLQGINALPSKNFLERGFDGAGKISGDVLKEYTTKSGTCHSCIVACKRITKSERYGITTDGPEYETLATFGAHICNDDIESIIKANDLCDDLGLDTISMGNAIAHFMEYSGGWGDYEIALELVEKTAYRRGIGDRLAEGVARYASSEGREGISVKGLDLPGYHPNALHGQALAFATSNRGADHLYSSYYLKEMVRKDRRELKKEKIARLIYNENRNAVLDSLILCKFSMRFYDMRDYLAIASLALGREVTEEEFLELGGRIVAAERLFNIKAGFSRKDDALPKRFEVPEMEEALKEYYAQRGWSEEGVPSANI
jgi:aldehyde:ferredoxin oxidoreductase